MPSNKPFENGSVGEQAAARKYNLELRSSSSGFYDATYRTNGRKVQIKSALYERADGPGVIRFWKENLQQLRAAGGSVVIVIRNPDNPDRKVLKVTKISPGELLERGSFRPTGQADMKPKHEARLRWPELVDL